MAVAKPKPEVDFESGVLHIYADTPEVGLVTLSYEASVNEWNLDLDSEKSLVVPDAIFRKAAAAYVNGGTR